MSFSRATLRSWRYWTAEVPTPARWSKAWWWEVGLVRNTVYALTGSTVKFLVKPAIRKGLRSTSKITEGSKGYHISCTVATLSIYPLVLLTVGTLLGRHHYFRGKATTMIRRLPGVKRLSSRPREPHADLHKPSDIQTSV